jgi:hypothetical protein
MEIEQRVINSGSKQLKLSVNLTDKTASIRFGTRKFSKIRHEPGETTRGYFIICEELQEIVDRSGSDINLFINTSNSRLKEWIFGNRERLEFDLIEPDDSSAYNINAYKKFLVNNT